MKNLRRLAGVLGLSMLFASGCAAHPGPAPIAEEQPAGSTQTSEPTPEVPAEKKNRDEIVVGIDPLKNGFNPHLVADDTTFVQSLANLVLPSTFNDGRLNDDMLLSAEEVAPAPGVAQTVRYRINEAAQWSDGAPITAADFTYLWTALRDEPAGVDTAGYAKIANVRSESGGKVVYVDFATAEPLWQQLFQHLLPSHLFTIGTDSFEKALATTIPASGGKYMVRNVDRRRGVVELARNDRFWGTQPANVELLTFREVTNTSQAVEMLRTQQMAYLDISPTETSNEALTLMAGAQVHTRSTQRQLQLNFNTAVLGDIHQRQALAGLIDIPQVARLAAGRAAELDIAAATTPEPGFLEQTKAQFGRPIRISADPADDEATTAAHVVAARLREAGFQVEVFATDFTDLTQKRLIGNNVDLSLSWAREPVNPLTAATQTSCARAENPTMPGNLSNYCSFELSERIAQWAAGGEQVDVAKELKDQAVVIPIMKDRRVEALGNGLIGPNQGFSQWPRGAMSGPIDTAAMWKKKVG
ncbi:ABC transporter family substrate-binding protein [Corynebacterium epidermidicanis]|uniref:Extracellular solute-binding protein, family 5 n=1 Tax=Corynebacterium epidermidicanis TaxID=1050174 RepID=A0A0G3GQH0_9CORY|nr:ABC transporter family substrate-binding protein [Corynebacterium epidermidicanis]AKK02805.1 extracellular solute-binding protein, family 5 [Corynebacterium epidermidicanis]